MTKQNNQHDDDALAALYEKRKARFTSPSDVKQQVLTQLATQKPIKTPWWQMNLRPFVQISALSGTLAVAFIVISIHMMNKNAVNMPLQSLALNEYQAVEVHQLAPLDDQLASAQERYENALKNKSLSSSTRTQERQVQYQRAQNVYLARQADLVVHQQRYATIMQNEDGLDLLTCNKHLLKLSQEVVDMLLSRDDEASIDYSQGQMLSLAFDEKGHIIYISQAKSTTTC